MFRRFFKVVAALASAASAVALLPATADAATPRSNGIVWYNSQTGETQLWYLNGGQLIDRATVLGESGAPTYIGSPFQIVATGDHNRDGSSDLVWYNSQTGETQLWYMNGNRLTARGTVVGANGLPVYIGPPYRIVGDGDMDRDGRADLLWYNDQTGEMRSWRMNGHRIVSDVAITDGSGRTVYIGPPYAVVGNADMNADGHGDIIWYNSQTGETRLWLMSTNRIASQATVVYANGAAALIGPPYRIEGVSDMNGDSKADLTWYNTQTGEIRIWTLDVNRLVTNTPVTYAGRVASVGPPFSVMGTGTFNAPSGAIVDDYPWSPTRCGHEGDCVGLDTWGFTKQQCVSFVAFRLSQRGIVLAGATWGDAKNWDDVARSRGYAVDGNPTVGSVAQWNENETSSWTVGNGSSSITAGSAGHVAFVTGLNPDGTVSIEEYNQNNDRSYHYTASIRAPRYLHIT